MAGHLQHHVGLAPAGGPQASDEVWERGGVDQGVRSHLLGDLEPGRHPVDRHHPASSLGPGDPHRGAPDRAAAGHHHHLALEIALGGRVDGVAHRLLEGHHGRVQ